MKVVWNQKLWDERVAFSLETLDRPADSSLVHYQMHSEVDERSLSPRSFDSVESRLISQIN